MMEQTEFALGERDFERIRERLYAVAGISLSDAKRTLVVARLSKIVRTMGLPTFDAYLDHLEHRATADDAQSFVNALTTNLTRFWREEHHFTHLEAYVGELVKSRTSQSDKRLRIWSAGCSTGQEPYTIALALLAAWPELRRWDFKILATDIDTSVIAKAATATYPESELSGLTPERARLFERIGGGLIRVPQAIVALVSFKPLNLMAPWPMKGPFDAVFCRNVAIYFDKQTQAEVFGRLGKILAPGGFLYIGHSENLGAGVAGYRLVGKTIYQSRGAERAKDAA
ncbi:MAG: protein-glutamate O-methyltransferase CheR [Devosia nanyangense]|uniref:Chemotaxis protein methyltransferase n=1 Tax=Devosia nanyangense TaxID=1228055 RepID=A0A933NXJ4_9HYPH|nr:protein-glutamate O-methyltransferase CheR [Devosia nanyangense]